MSDHADTIRDALNFGMGWAYSEGALDDHSERDAALAALDALLAENQRLRDALERLKSNVWAWEVPDDVREQVDAALAAVRVEDER